ncbi:hypothetical protein [Rhizobium laguerreae]|uniref:hypothetical protein n=1 Tax=Rhizobium laguerreae TaxID=1076926 RepID=UPI001C9123E4|nr:hypothetical protein [Rhizobium laguerreae]MBY3081018.1 hypothetical protein [Rhizobium laguerreae]MBY3114918.1 hypothetical protein [Rhizobium laguerreae]
MERRTSFVTKRSILSTTTIAVWITKSFAGMYRHDRTLRKIKDQGPESLSFMKVEVWRPACWPVWHNLDLIRDYNDHHLVSRTRRDVETYMMLSGVDVYMLGAVADPQARTQMTMLPRLKPPSTARRNFRGYRPVDHRRRKPAPIVGVYK